MEDIQVALVTGANQGIGLQIARHRASHGFTVLVGARNLERGEAVAKSIHGDQALQLDVTDRASIAAAAERIRDEFGRLDVLINNAAMSNTGLRPGMTVGEYSKSPRQSNVSLDLGEALADGQIILAAIATEGAQIDEEDASTMKRAPCGRPMCSGPCCLPSDAVPAARGATRTHCQNVERCNWLGETGTSWYGGLPEMSTERLLFYERLSQAE